MKCGLGLFGFDETNWQNVVFFNENPSPVYEDSVGREPIELTALNDFDLANDGGVTYLRSLKHTFRSWKLPDMTENNWSLGILEGFMRNHSREDRLKNIFVIDAPATPVRNFVESFLCLFTFVRIFFQIKRIVLKKDQTLRTRIVDNDVEISEDDINRIEKYFFVELSNNF